MKEMWVAEIHLTREKMAFGQFWSFIFCVNLPILTGENISKGVQRISVPPASFLGSAEARGVLQLCTSHGKGILCHISLGQMLAEPVL